MNTECMDWPMLYTGNPYITGARGSEAVARAGLLVQQAAGVAGEDWRATPAPEAEMQREFPGAPTGRDRAVLAARGDHL